MADPAAELSRYEARDRWHAFFQSWRRGGGWTIYMVEELMSAYDSMSSLILQPVLAAVVSTASVGAVLLAGVVLRVSPIGRLWHSGRGLAGLLAVACLAVMCFGSTLGITAAYTDPETGR